ncbi:MAG: Zn-dependent M16 (insulinase) family peptidase, partial [bacterium]
MNQDINNPNLKVGSIVSGFEVKEITYLSKLHVFLYELEHQKTGAQMMHLSNDDDNNCFGVAFRTTPKDSTGVAHILEHTALCGSKKYPVRDPFFSMIRRSMKTFMNAFTASDWTMYPFSSQNEKDFYNLMGVYLDAAFFPLLDEPSFKQEGHRLEFSEEGNLDSPLEIKGIVYNEMKGAMSAPASILGDKIGNTLFPTITYQHNSGGKPSDIPNLTWEQLKEFHQVHYHPSNSFFYSYGTLSLEKHLSFIEDNALNQFEKIDPNTEVGNEIRLTEPKKCKFQYPLDEEENDGAKNQVAVAWLCSDIREPLEVLSLQLLNLILLGNAAAPLRKALIDSDLGKSLADTTGFEDETKETYFSVGLQGVAEKDVDKVENLILETLQKIAEEGIEDDRIASAIHQMELMTREISGGGFPYSLNLLFRFFGTWMHGGDPKASINFDANLNALKEKIAQGSFLEDQIKKYFIENQHRVQVILSPSSTIEKEENSALEKQLEEVKQKLSEEEKTKLMQSQKEMKEFQEQEEDLSILPTLTVQDIPKEISKVFPLNRKHQTFDVKYYQQPTNGILYFSLHFKIQSIAEEDRKYLPLLSYLFVRCGAGGLSYEEISALSTRYTGGLSAAPSIQNQVDQDELMDLFTISGKCLDENQGKFFEIVKKYLYQWDFSDLKYIHNLIKQRSNDLNNSVVQSGHSYASSLAQRKFSQSCKIDEIYGGVAQVQFMREVASFDDEKLQELTKKLDNLVKQLFFRDQVSLLVIGSQSCFDESETLIDDLLKDLPKSLLDKKETLNNELTPEFLEEAWLTTTPVSYVVRCFQAPKYIHPDAPKLKVLGRLLQSGFLHGEIREKGGAYGGMASFDDDEGIFSLLSYRDPHLKRTIDVYQGAIDWLFKGDFSEQDVEEAILQTCSQLDTPLSPAGKASSHYQAERKGRSYELREKFRHAILTTTREELIEVGKKWLVKESSTVVVSSETILNQQEGLSL